MKFTINGFQQDKLLEFGLDATDTVILNFFQDMYFSTSDKIKFKMFGDEKFIWVTHKYILKQIPIVGTVRTLQRRIEKYEKIGLFKTEFVRSKEGTHNYYALSSKYNELKDYTPHDKMSEGGTTKCHTGYDKMSEGGTTKCPTKNNIYNNNYIHSNYNNISLGGSTEHSECEFINSENFIFKSQEFKDMYLTYRKFLIEELGDKFTKQKEDLIIMDLLRFAKDNEEKAIAIVRKAYASSWKNVFDIKDFVSSKSTEENEETTKEIVDYLNNRINSKYSYKSTEIQKLVALRMSEGYTLEEFKKVIDNMYIEWNGGKYENYLRPKTLFGENFANYLNWKQTTSTKVSDSDYVPDYTKRTKYF